MGEKAVRSGLVTGLRRDLRVRDNREHSSIGAVASLDTFVSRYFRHFCYGATQGSPYKMHDSPYGGARYRELTLKAGILRFALVVCCRSKPGTTVRDITGCGGSVRYNPRQAQQAIGLDNFR